MQQIKTQVGPLTVSTVQLRIPSYGPGDEDMPTHGYETMVFDFKKSGYLELACDRYRTEEEARAGHEAMVAEYAKQLRELGTGRASEAIIDVEQ